MKISHEHYVYIRHCSVQLVKLEYKKKPLTLFSLFTRLAYGSKQKQVVLAEFRPS